MPQIVFLCIGWWHTKTAWKKRAAVLFILTGAVAAVALSLKRSPGQQAFIILATLAGTASLLRLAGVRMFGPVLAYDLVRSARQGRQLTARCTYAGVVLAMLLWTYSVWLGDTVHAPIELFSSAAMPAYFLARFATSFFIAFASVQLLAVFALTPAYTAGVIAQERQRGTLDALLATELGNHEIIFSLFVSRLADLTLLLSTGLPILALTILWGGVDIELILAVFAGTALFMVSLAALSILQSVHAQRPRDAIVRTYLLSVGYLVLSGGLYVFLLWAGTLGWNNVLSKAVLNGDQILTVHDILEWLCTGNPAVMVDMCRQTGSLWQQVANFSLFHAVAAIMCIAVAIIRLRKVARMPTSGKPQEPSAIVTKNAKRPGRRRRPARLGTHGMFWKETVAEARPGRGTLGWLWLGVRSALLFWPALHICYHLGQWLPLPGERLIHLMNFWVRAATILLSCFMLLSVAVRAAGSISGERDRRTLDGLLVTPLHNRIVLFAKWLGSILGTRGAWIRLGLVWTLGIFFGALHPLAVVCLVLAWLVYAAFLASLGLWFSVISRTAPRAMLGTLLVTLAAVVAPGMAAYDLMDNWHLPLEGYALISPATLGLLAFTRQEYEQWGREIVHLRSPAIAIQLGVWSLAAIGFYVLASLRYRILTGRIAPPKPSTTSTPTLITRAAPETGTRADALGSTTTDSKQEEEEFLITATASRWPLRLRNAVLVLMPMGLLLGCYARLLEGADQDLEETLAQTNRLDLHWRLEDLEANRLVVTDAENSALQTVKARSMLPKDWDPTEADQAVGHLDPEMLLQPQEVAIVRAALSQVQPALTEARRLSGMPTGRYPITWSRDAYSTQLPHAQELRRIAALLALDILLRAHETDANGALTSCQAMINAGRSLGDEPMLISILVRIAIVQTALNRIERTLAQSEPSDAALASLQQLLLDEDRQPLLLFGLSGERASSSRFLEAMRSGAADIPSFIVPVRGSRWERWFFEMAMPFVAGSLKSAQADFLRRETELVETAKLPPVMQGIRFGQIKPPPRSNVLGRLFYPAVDGVIFAYRREQAQLRCTLMGLAVERYRIKHDRWPATLNEAVSDQIGQVPLDPYDNQPLRYAQLADGVVVYSVGPDRVDNGGKLDRKNIGAAGSDIGTRLWDSKRRRQSPPQVFGPPSEKSRDSR